MQRLVLIGRAVSHSLSPRIHNELFEAYRLPLRYLLMPMEEDGLAGAVDSIRRGDILGANVTSPYKTSIVPLLDRLSPSAVAVGGVNTIVLQEGECVGHNTDVEGFAGSLSGVDLLSRNFSANILGTGAAANAAVVALLENGNLERITLYSRNRERAAAAVARFGDLRLLPGILDEYQGADLVVHATPVGLNDSSRALLRADQLTGTSLLYEMIYSPSETLLMQRARSAGCRTLGGLPMLLRQALASFQLWTGIEPDPAHVPADLRQALNAFGVSS